MVFTHKPGPNIFATGKLSACCGQFYLMVLFLTRQQGSTLPVRYAMVAIMYYEHALGDKNLFKKMKGIGKQEHHMQVPKLICWVLDLKKAQF